MKLKPGRTLIWDLETDGLLPELTRIHILVIKDFNSGETFVFRRNRQEDTILEGLKMLNEAEYLIGHNIVGFDCPALWKVYGDLFAPTGKVRDTLVMARMLYADEKERDFRRWRRGDLDGKYIGSHELAAWGQRLGYPKDDYAKRKAAELKERHPEKSKDELSRLVWAKWNQEMEDYAVIDVTVTDALWERMAQVSWSEEAIILEHSIHGLMERTTENGFPFNVEAALKLEDELRTQFDDKTAKAKDHFGSWWVPTKWVKGATPKPEYGEDRSRKFWGGVIVPKRTCNYTDKTKAGRLEGAAYCPIKLIDFNPNSRQQIVNRLEKIYGWVPQEHTDKGNPVVNDEVLRDLIATVPIAYELAEIFYYQKRLGQLIDGKAGWIGKAAERGDNRIHPRFIVGGTVTNRASHSNPNIAQVPRVVFKKLPLLDADGQPIFDEEGKPKLQEKKTLMKGRAGDHGWECRNLFMVPEGWEMMGSDQKGIELRCLGHYMAEFDGGEYGRLCVESDPHDLHQEVMGLNSRDLAKTFIYAMIYGAADYKLGVTVDPSLALNETKARALGAEMRRRITTRIEALGKVVKEVQRESSRGFVSALDGRKLFVRKKHSALNTKLQGAGATISKKWCVLFEEYMEDAGMEHGWDGDFAILAWVHDELQVAIRDNDRHRMIAKECITRAAVDAGKSFNFRLPVDVDVKFGRTWAGTH